MRVYEFTDSGKINGSEVVAGRALGAGGKQGKVEVKNTCSSID